MKTRPEGYLCKDIGGAAQENSSTNIYQAPTALSHIDFNTNITKMQNNTEMQNYPETQNYLRLRKMQKDIVGLRKMDVQEQRSVRINLAKKLSEKRCQ